MARTNPQGREIWFDRWLWSYMPCHWKGWAVIAASIAGGLTGSYAVGLISNPRNGPPSAWSGLFLVAAVILMRWIAERHAPPKRRDL